MKQIVLSCSLAALMCGHALAADLSHNDTVIGALTAPSGTPAVWTGIYGGVGVGFDANSIGAKDEYNQPVDLSADGVVITGRLGYDKQFSSVVVGIFGDIDWNNAKASFEDGSIAADYSYALGLRGGMLFGNVLGYVNGGWQWTHFTITGAPSYNPDGFFAGAGLEAPLGAGFSLAVEGRKAWSSDKVDGDSIDNNDYSARVLLIKKFN